MVGQASAPALGISDSIDAGACLVADGRIVAAVSEERLSRRKFHTGLPVRAMSEVLRIAGVARLLSGTGLLKWMLSSRSGIALYRAAFAGLLKPRLARIRRHLREIGVTAPLTTVDHHRAHAASAAFTSGWDDCLVVSLDASGDGYCTLVSEKRGGALTDRERIGAFHSLGIFYLYVTMMLGHKPGREGKITGLAAHGDTERTLDIFRRYVGYDAERETIRNLRSGYACDYADLKRDLEGFAKEDVAAGVQRHFEECITRYVLRHVKETGLGRVALAGGVFANVRVNQCIRELPEVEDIYVFPHMGDGGGAPGSALDLTHNPAGEGNLENVYLGPAG